MYYVLETPNTPEYKKLLQDDLGHMNACKWKNIWTLDNAKFKQEKRILNKLAREVIAIVVEAEGNMANTSKAKDDPIEWTNKEDLLCHLSEVFERHLHHFEFITKEMKP